MGERLKPFHGAIDWMTVEAPSIEDIETMAVAALDQLPDDFLKLCDGMVLRVEDFPDDDVIEELALETEFDLLGLFQGHGLAHGSAVAETGQMPNMVTLYRRPILDYWAEHEENLGAVITHVLVHEIGHHFGLSDDDMERIEAAAD